MPPIIKVRNTIWRDASLPLLLTYPNEPVGYAAIFEYDFTTPLLHGVDNSNGTEISGCIYKWDPGGTQFAVIDVPDGGQQSPTKTMRYRWPSGQAPGTGAGKARAWICPAASSGFNVANRYKEVYGSEWFNLEGAGDGTYENQQIGTKVWGYWGVGNSNGTASDAYLLLSGLGAGTYIASTFNFRYVQQNHVNRSLGHNVNTGFRIQVGVWYQMESLFQLNFPASASNGVLKIWLNGTLVIDYADVQWRTAAAPDGFYGRGFAPIFGGAGGGNKTRIDDIYWDHMYISGIQGE